MRKTWRAPAIQSPSSPPTRTLLDPGLLAADDLLLVEAVAELGKENGFPVIAQESEDRPVVDVDAMDLRRQERLEVHFELRLAGRERRAEPLRERPLLCRRQRLHALDRDPAEVEEAKDRASRLRDRECGGQREQRGSGQREQERPAAAARLEAGAHCRNEVGRGRKLELAAERDECVLERSHSVSLRRLRARAVRDLTVPTRTPRATAVSSSDRPRR